MTEFFTWGFLMTFGGAAIATTIITQFIKDAAKAIPTQIVSYFIALVVLLGATAATGAAQGWQDWLLVPFNALLVSLASNGVYDAGTRITGQ